jgi:coenzyme PQQ precursor peptide PqqA
MEGHSGGRAARAYRADKLFLSYVHAIAISVYRGALLGLLYWARWTGGSPHVWKEEEVMKVWTKPAVREQEVGLEVTSYLPAEIDII